MCSGQLSKNIFFVKPSRCVDFPYANFPLFCSVVLKLLFFSGLLLIKIDDRLFIYPSYVNDFFHLVEPFYEYGVLEL